MRKSVFFLSMGILLFGINCKSSRTGNAGSAGITAVDTVIITDKRWKLIELNGQQVPDMINGRQPLMEFSGTGNRYSAVAGCNGIGGTFLLSGMGRIRFSQGMSTMMACDHMEFEIDLKKVLGDVDNYTVKGNTLSLNKARMAPLARFVLLDEDIATRLNGAWELSYMADRDADFNLMYTRKRPVINLRLPDSKATGNSSCNHFNVLFELHGKSLHFESPVSTKMACDGGGEAAFFGALKRVSGYRVNEKTLTLLAGDTPLMRFDRKP